MGSEHQALLEAMEQQSISVAKAGIGRLLVYNASANAGVNAGVNANLNAGANANLNAGANAGANASANAGANVCVIVYDVQPH